MLEGSLSSSENRLRGERGRNGESGGRGAIGWMGDNILKESVNMDWWKDCDAEVGKETVHADTVDNAPGQGCRVPERPASVFMRMPTAGIYKAEGVGDVLARRVESGGRGGWFCGR